MKKYLKEVIILLIQLFMFYIFPLFAGPTDAIGMVFLILISTFILSILLIVISKNKIKYLYPLVIAILFIPSVFIYYNSSALIHSIWYLVVSFIGISIGLLIKFISNKKSIFIFLILVLITIIILLLTTGGKRTDVYLKGYEVSSDGKIMTLYVGVSSSTGYIRKMKRTSGSMNYYFTFYSTYFFNSKIGSKDTFEIELDSNVDEIYFYIGKKGYRKVLELNDDGKWVIPNIEEDENISTRIYDISSTGATIVITDNSKDPYIYSEWYKIEKEYDGKWIELQTKTDNYGFNDMGYLVNDNNEVKFTMDWELIYGELSQGSYRIVKEIGYKKYIYISFSIATTS